MSVGYQAKNRKRSNLVTHSTPALKELLDAGSLELDIIANQKTLPDGQAVIQVRLPSDPCSLAL